ncbi:MAG: PQQ-dependent sugar dehydrogenase [Planctomycetes bacterium]|nr:PQQ-dependent sugar dehydrogenase [Planctomycetota bacterium]
MDLRLIRTYAIVCSLAALALECSAVHAGGTLLTTVRIATGLQRPVGLTAPVGDAERVFVIEKRGRIRVIQNSVLLPTPFMDIDALVGGGNSNNDERGLLGLAFHPDYFNNGFFYVNHTNNSSDTAIARYTVLGDPATSNVADLGSRVSLLIIDQPEGNHNGGWIAFSPNDGYLYIAMGDGGGANDQHPFPGNGQNLNNCLGAMLRIDVDNGDPYDIPPDNPFADGPGGACDEIWAYGLRNPWRNSFDPENGNLYIADVGQSAREEVNFQRGDSTGGENYGWRCMEGNLCTGLSGCTCNDPSLTRPIHQYSHGGSPFRCSITGGELYRGCAIPDLQGTYFFADFCSEQIWSLRIGVLGVEDRTAELAPSGSSIDSISSFGRDGLGEIYICDQGSSSANGEIFKIVAADGSNACVAPCPADLDGNGTVGAFDLALLLGAWGPNPGHPADFDGDGNVNAFDLAQLLGDWGPCK